MMSRAWSTTSVPPRCAQLRRSPGNCSVDRTYAPNYKPVRFSTVRNSSLRVPRARRRNGGVARFLEMQLLHAAVIGFGNGNQITINLNLFAGLRELAPQMSHLPADRAYIGAFQIKLREIV